jgi:hypothetical protein
MATQALSKKLNQKPEAGYDFPPLKSLASSVWCLFMALLSVCVGVLVFIPAGIEGATQAILKTYREGMR